MSLPEGLVRKRIGQAVFAPRHVSYDYLLEAGPQVENASVVADETRIPHPVAGRELSHDELRVHSQLDAAGAKGKSGLQRGDGGAILRFVVRGDAEASGDAIHLLPAPIEDSGADGRGARIAAGRAVGVDNEGLFWGQGTPTA